MTKAVKLETFWNDPTGVLKNHAWAVRGDVCQVTLREIADALIQPRSVCESGFGVKRLGFGAVAVDDRGEFEAGNGVDHSRVNDASGNPEADDCCAVGEGASDGEGKEA